MHATLCIARAHGPDGPIVQPEYTLDRDTRFGRAVDSDICLPDPSVSRRHATVLIRQGLWYVVDEGSTSGTFLNDKRLEQGAPSEIRSGDRLALGPWVFRVKDPGTITHTVDLSGDELGMVVGSELTSRRLDALGGYLAAISRASSTEETAACTIEAALAGTGFRRGAVLLAPESKGAPPAYLAGRKRDTDGICDELSSEDFHASSKLVGRALEGFTARYSAPDADITDHSRSLVENSVIGALCVPVKRDGVVESLIYLDSRGNTPGVENAVGYCEDIASLFAYALTHRAHAELSQRQQAMRIEFEHAKELRAMLTTPSVAPGSVFRQSHRSLAGMFVSADFYDTVTHADGSLHVLFGDATGHGLGASILTTLVHAHLIALLRSGVATGEAVTMTNRFISEKATAGRFVSLVVAHLKPDGEMSIVDAGHGHWVHRSTDGHFAPAQAGAVPIGIDPNACFSSKRRTLEAGDRLVLYTDGVTEQEDPDGAAFGTDRLHAVLKRSGGCREDIEGLFDALLTHAGGRALEDDATIASIERSR